MKKTRKIKLDFGDSFNYYFRLFGGKLPNATKRKYQPTYNPTYHEDDAGTWRWSDSDRECYYSRYGKQYWDPGTHITHVRSFAEIGKNSRVLSVYFHEDIRTWTLPIGFIWDIDQNGIRVVRSKDGADHHPELGRLISVGCISHCLEELEKNAETRLKVLSEIKKTQKVLKKVGKDIRVVFSDSTSSGNCFYGTLKFCERHNLNKTKSYTPKELINICNGDEQRVRLAIRYAEKRHCRLAEYGAEVFYP